MRAPSFGSDEQRPSCTQGHQHVIDQAAVIRTAVHGRGAVHRYDLTLHGLVEDICGADGRNGLGQNASISGASKMEDGSRAIEIG